MCYIKSLFWDDEEVVIQYHPKKSEYVNLHPYCLHLWKPIGIEIPTPPKEMVYYYCKPFNPADFNIAKDLKEYEK